MSHSSPPGAQSSGNLARAGALAAPPPRLTLTPRLMLALCLALSLSLAGCTRSVLGIKPLPTYVRQGNFMVVEDFRKLRRGMTRVQVLYLIGTPAVEDPFDDTRWDYYYSYEQPGNILRRRHIVVLFDQQEKLQTWFELEPGQTFVRKDFGELLSEEDEFDLIEKDAEEREKKKKGGKKDGPTADAG